MHPLRDLFRLLPLAGIIAIGLSSGCKSDETTGAAATTSATAAVGSGGQGGAGGASGGSNTGGGMPCSADADCPASQNECMAPVCQGTCGFAPVAAGTPVATQVPGDCRLVVCDGAGATQPQADDTDVPNDGNDCTGEGCSSGVPTQAPMATGTKCSAGFCDGAGTCVECVGPLDCPGTDTECQSRSCDNHVCGVEDAMIGTALAIQTAGDCHIAECDGLGGTTNSVDNTDVPDDLNPCTQDACNSGMPTHTPTPGVACGTNGVCDSTGQCVGCSLASDCPGVDDFCKTRTCISSACGFSYTSDGTVLPAASQQAGDCQQLQCNGAGAPKSVALDSDLPVDGNECTADVCTSGTASNPDTSAGTACTQAGGAVCNGAGQCVACNGPSDCPAAPTCHVATCSASGTCGTANAQSGTVCAAASCTAGTQQAASTCDGAGSCVPGATTSCAPYVCGPTACTTSCTANADCASGDVCDVDLHQCKNGPTCTKYCDDILQNCTSLPQYDSRASCDAVCAVLPPGLVGDGSGDTLGCRDTHAVFAASQPNPHCYHAGPGGAAVCGTDCEGFCTIAQGVCTGGNAVWSSVAACESDCMNFDDTTPYTTAVTSGNTLACRLYHVTQAAILPATHCPHIGVTSAVCK